MCLEPFQFSMTLYLRWRTLGTRRDEVGAQGIEATRTRDWPCHVMIGIVGIGVGVNVGGGVQC